jgi:hypothetical protein
VAELDVRGDQVQQQEKVQEKVKEERAVHPGPGQTKGIKG